MSPSTLTETTTAIQAFTVIGQLYDAASRGVVGDLFGAYGRLLKLQGRDIDQDVAPTMQWHDGPLIPLSATRISETRLAILQEILGCALRNADSLDARAHWRETDAHMKGLALAEANLAHASAVEHRRVVAEFEAEGDYGMADFCRTAAKDKQQAELDFQTLAMGEGWTR